MKAIFLSLTLVASSSLAQYKGVCVFDYDFTLSCSASKTAVQLCIDNNFALAINTARDKKKAQEILDSNILYEKGFPEDFIKKAKAQRGLEGAFQYYDGYDSDNLEQKYHPKSYGMRKIAEHYNFKLDDLESRKLVLFDDMLHNIVQMESTCIDPNPHTRCRLNPKGLCYQYPADSPDDVEFPRNWKIYKSKWVGHFCSRWNRKSKVEKDVNEAIDEINSY